MKRNFFKKLCTIGIMPLFGLNSNFVSAMDPQESGSVKFSTDMPVSVFTSHYWYTDQLRDICGQCGLSRSGTKRDLTQRIIQILPNDLDETDGEELEEEDLKVDLPDSELGLVVSDDSEEYARLQTKVLGGFNLGSPWREFIGAVLGISGFKFNKEMAATVREIKRRGDYSVTVLDLLKINYVAQMKKAQGMELPFFMTGDEKSYQWNNFVRAFNSDPRSQYYTNKMKVASILWVKVRDNPVPKVYDSSLIDMFESEIAEFRIG
jgi:hypothetical protein